MPLEIRPNLLCTLGGADVERGEGGVVETARLVETVASLQLANQLAQVIVRGRPSHVSVVEEARVDGRVDGTRRLTRVELEFGGEARVERRGSRRVARLLNHRPPTCCGN